jgi:hypothetical protein
MVRVRECVLLESRRRKNKIEFGRTTSLSGGALAPAPGYCCGGLHCQATPSHAGAGLLLLLLLQSAFGA